jgi:Zn-dependent peptidase ImmA (M78 family)/transcriptional regulator with XRE-family HTH domain
LYGISQADAAALVRITPAALSQFESGTSRPTEATLERLSTVYGVPATFFTLSTETVHEGFFRSLRRTSVIDRRRAQAIACVAHDIATLSAGEKNFSHTSIPKHPVTAPDTSSDDIEQAASHVRMEWGMPPGPVSNVVGLLEEHGVVVVRLAFDSSDIDAFSVAFADRPVVVLVSDKSDRARSRFDAAHELGHLVLHGSEIWGTPEVEKQAYLFASAFLMPRDEICSELPNTVDWPKLFQLKRRWHVSLAALLMRARTLGRLSESAYIGAIKTASARGWRRVEPIPLGSPEEPRLLRAVLESPANIRLQRVLPHVVLDSLMLMSPLPVRQRAVQDFAQGTFAFDDPPSPN